VRPHLHQYMHRFNLGSSTWTPRGIHAWHQLKVNAFYSTIQPFSDYLLHDDSHSTSYTLYSLDTQPDLLAVKGHAWTASNPSKHMPWKNRYNAPTTRYLITTFSPSHSSRYYQRPRTTGRTLMGPLRRHQIWEKKRISFPTIYNSEHPSRSGNGTHFTSPQRLSGSTANEVQFNGSKYSQ